MNKQKSVKAKIARTASVWDVQDAMATFKGTPVARLYKQQIKSGRAAWQHGNTRYRQLLQARLGK